MDTTNTDTLLAAGLGRQGRRNGRPLHLTVSDALARFPTLSRAAIKRGWYAERADETEDLDASTIGGGL
jgi:hypothetical protein